MNIGIIGHRGFIGSHLIALMGNLGHSIFPISLEETRGCTTWSKALNSVPVELDYVIHAAGKADVSASFLNPDSDFSSNTKLVFDVLDALRTSQHKSSGFIFLSSAAVYGNPSSLPISTSALINPISPYGFHKATAELLVKSFCQCFGMKGISLRIFSAYGEGNRKQVLWELCKKCKKSPGGILEVQGTGEETRDFIHINDLVNQIRILLECSPFSGEIYNSGNGKEIEIKIIAEMLAEKMGLKSVIFNHSEKHGYPQRWQADIDFMLMNGYTETVNIEIGISNYCQWFNEFSQDE